MASGDYARISNTGGGLQHYEDDEGALQLDDDHEAEDSDAKTPLRPHVYYDEGPFDAPSSESDEETLMEKTAQARSPGEAEIGFADLNFKDPRSRNRSLRFLLIILGSLVLAAMLIGFIAANTYSGTSFALLRGSKPLTMDHVFNGTFYAQHESVRWVPEAGDGVYANVDRSRNTISLFDLKTNTTRDLVNLDDIRILGGSISFMEWKLSPNMRFLLVKTDYRKQWRHSSFGNYYVHNIEAKSTYPLISPSNPSVTAYATWSPTGEAIAFVHSNDLYIKPDAQESTSPIRITTTGSETHFNGVPDWVYEEEVFSADYALWWSPDSKKVAFIESDETEVDVYSFPVYNPDYDSYAVHPYTHDVAMRYPKPGYNNPLVDVQVFDLEEYLSGADSGAFDRIDEYLSKLTWASRQPSGDSIIMEVAWVGSESLVVKEVNRAGNEGSVVLFDTRELSVMSTEVEGTVVRTLGKNGEEGDNGWIESRQSITRLSDDLVSSLGLIGPAYLDFVNDTNGFVHIALFSPAGSSEPKFVSNGSWEVVGDILGIDKQGVVYFAAAYPSSIERSILSARIPSSSAQSTAQLVPLTDVSSVAWYEADFSPEAGYYVLGYRGPNVPWQSIYQTGKPKDVYEYKLADNARLNDTLAEYQTPLRMHSTIEVDGYELNVMELIPPYFDDSGRTKYPVLFRVYGGPGSQMVHTRFDVDWHAYLVCTLKYVVVVVDGRGTGFKGRGLRNPIRDNMGNWETKDQIEAARIWAGKPYVDPKRIGIWGWSYGGFMSSKVIEANAGVHSLAIAVAPVTSWRLYDSIYTERYMSTPAQNPSGYTVASITNMTGFHSASYALAHGSGDDNVHFANSAHMLDMLTRDQVRGFRFRMFTDSDHSIQTRGAYRELHEWMTEFLLEKWGVGGKKRQW